MTVYEELAARVKAPKSKIVSRLFEFLADEIDAKILLALPSNIPDLVERLGLSAEELEDRLHELYLRGVVYLSRKTSPITYRTATDVVHLHDTSVQWKTAPVAFLDLWQEWIETEYPVLARGIAKMMAGKKPLSRIIAANIWLEPKSNVLHFDSLKEIVNNARSLAVLPCTCRIKAKKCDHTLEACIVLNSSADYNIERGTGRKIDAKEALEIFKKCEKEGLVHLTGANAQNNPGPLICNCCPCCCMGLPLMMQGLDLNDPSRFCAQIKRDLCSGCGMCHERCYFGAITWEGAKEEVSVVNPEKCLGCGLCQVICPEQAIEMFEAKPIDFVPETGSSLY